MILHLSGKELDPHYLGYFECFNQQLYYEAHDVLEELWLPQRKLEGGSFYKGLIQLAGAFVHLQKNRLQPAAALFKLSRSNLEKFPSPHQHLDTRAILQLIEKWLMKLESTNFASNPLPVHVPPRIDLIEISG